MAQILDGKATAKKIETEVAEEVKKLSYKPGLHVILVGDDPASAVYVGGKEKATARVGINGKVHKFEKTDTNHLLGLVKELNSDDSVDGILVQLPLPSNIDSKLVLNSVSPDKDVDGFHPFNVGKLVLGEKGLRPCTPAGVMRLLEEYKVEISGKRAVIVGRSNIVGKPMSIMLLEKHATVTICHSRTKDLCAEVRQADIVVGAIGKAKFIGGDWIKKDAVVIDVGINRTCEGKLCGDVDFEEASKAASMITPVPGGVGPLTIAMLMKNTLDASKMRRGL